MEPLHKEEKAAILRLAPLRLPVVGVGDIQVGHQIQIKMVQMAALVAVAAVLMETAQLAEQATLHLHRQAKEVMEAPEQLLQIMEQAAAVARLRLAETGHQPFLETEARERRQPSADRLLLMPVAVAVVDRRFIQLQMEPAVLAAAAMEGHLRWPLKTERLIQAAVAAAQEIMRRAKMAALAAPVS
jgi:hypothetical protein